MLGNINRTLLLVICASVFLIGIIIGIIIFVKSIMFSRKKVGSSKLKYTLVSVLCIIIAVVSWFLNFGWLRFIMIFLPIPIIHTIAFMIISNFALSYIDKSTKLKKYIILTYITYLISYSLLPDGGDVGSMYVFFGIIHNDTVADICYAISYISFLGNIILLVLQIIETVKMKKQNSN